MTAPQTYRNHARWRPPFHFFVLPVMLGNVILSIRNVVREPSVWSAWQVAFAFALFVGILMGRVHALAAQDRLIRLEQQLRLGRILPPDMQSLIARLAPRHFIGLRFASDAEVPGLIKRVLAGELDQTNDIKKAIQDWQPDYLRV
jgi:hypothetical protein